MSLYIFWDNSNIFIPAKYVATRRDGGFAEQGIRIQFDNSLGWRVLGVQ